ncbi:MAG: response regulator transcription factor, partial [Nitrospirae bacterium]
MVWLNVSSLPIPSRKRDRFWVAHLFRDITKQAKVRQLVNELHTALCCVGSEGPEPRADQLPEVTTALPLSEREREVLYLLASGTNTKSIADSLCISPATVRNHIQHILEKLGAHT